MKTTSHIILCLLISLLTLPLHAQSLTALKYAGSGDGVGVGNGVVDSHSVKSLSDRYNKEREKLMVGIYTAKAGQVITQASFWGMATALTVTTGGVAGPIILGSIAYGSDQLMEFGVGKAEEARQYQSQKMILSMFKKEPDLGALENKTPEAVFNQLMSNDKNFESTFLKMDSAEQTALTQSAVSQISKNLAAFGSYQNARDALQDKVDVAQSEDIAALGKKVAESGIKIASVLQKQGEALSALATNQMALSKEIADISNQTKNNTANINFLNEFMFGKMTPAEQRVALQAGVVGKSLSAGQRSDFDKKLKVLELRDEITSNVNTFLEGANTAIKIASAIGIDPSLVAGVSKATQIVAGVTNAVGSIMSGNYFAALGSICGLFGGGKDAAVERHEEVMNALQQLAKGQAQIMEGINQLKEGINMLLEGQVEIMKMIGSVVELVEKNQKELMGELGVVREGLDGIQQVLNQVASQAIDSCKLFLKYRNNYFIDGAFPNYEKLSLHFELNRNKFAECVNSGFTPLITLLQMDERGQQVSAILRAENAENLKELVLFARDIYKPAFNAFTSLVIEPSSEEERLGRFAALLMPAQTWKELQSKGKSSWSLDVDGPIYPGNFQNSHVFANFLSKPLRPIMVGELVDLLVEFLPYYALLSSVESSATLLTKEQLTSDYRKELRAEGIELARRALGLLNLTIAQQSILSGEMILPYASRLLSKIKNKEALNKRSLEKATYFAEALKNNEILQKNVGALIVRETLAATAGSRSAYAFAYSQKDPLGISKIISNKFKYQKEDDKWTAEVDEKWTAEVVYGKDADKKDLSFKFILPSGTEDYNLRGAFYTRDELPLLLRTKVKLIDQILDLDFENQLGASEEDKALAAQMVVGK